jgi:hypothetical protein
MICNETGLTNSWQEQGVNGNREACDTDNKKARLGVLFFGIKKSD